MTEADWLTSSNPEAMLNGLADRLDPRKLRLFACACCRRIWHLVRDPSGRQAVEMAEAFAEGMLSDEELGAIHTRAQNNKPLSLEGSWAAAWCAAPDAAQAAGEAAYQAAMMVAIIGSDAAKSRAMAAVCSGAPEADRQAAWEHYEQVVTRVGLEEARAQADLLREIVGNPFRKLTLPAMPMTVVEMATALDAGEDCIFALHDALLDAGCTDLAEHFADASRPHPKGCWVLDGILGK